MSDLYSAVSSEDCVDNIRFTPTTNSAPKHDAETSKTLLLNASAPMAIMETFDDLDDGETLNKLTLFLNNEKDKHPDVNVNTDRPEQSDPDMEIAPVHSKDPEPTEPPDEIPDFTPNTDDSNGKYDGPISLISDERQATYAAAYPYSYDLEVGSMPGKPESIPDVNIYQHKKTLAQGMMDLALFSATANQLRYVLESYNRHPYYLPSIFLITISLILQIAVGIGLIWNSRYNIKDQDEICKANKINNFTVIGIFLVTVINVFISAFGVGSPK